jgi:hypothetical protein
MLKAPMNITKFRSWFGGWGWGDRLKKTGSDVDACRQLGAAQRRSTVPCPFLNVSTSALLRCTLFPSLSALGPTPEKACFPHMAQEGTSF